MPVTGAHLPIETAILRLGVVRRPAGRRRCKGACGRRPGGGARAGLHSIRDVWAVWIGWEPQKAADGCRHRRRPVLPALVNHRLQHRQDVDVDQASPCLNKSFQSDALEYRTASTEVSLKQQCRESPSGVLEEPNSASGQRQPPHAEQC